VGPNRRQVRARAHAHAHHFVVLGVHFSKCVRYRSLAARHSSTACGHRSWRRVGYGRHVRSRGMARAPAPRRRWINAYRILRRNISGCTGELRHWQPFWLACHVHRWRTSCFTARLDSSRGDGTGRLDKERKSSAVVGVLASLHDFIFRSVATPHHRECLADAGFYLWSVGGNCVCSRGDHRCRGGWRPRRSASRSARLVGHHDGFVCHHSRLPGNAVAR